MTLRQQNGRVRARRPAKGLGQVSHQPEEWSWTRERIYAAGLGHSARISALSCLLRFLYGASEGGTPDLSEDKVRLSFSIALSPRIVVVLTLSEKHGIGRMPELFDADWFRMPDVRRRLLSAGVWIPLRQSEQLATGGTKWRPGYFEETLCVGTLAIFQDRRAIGENLSWGDIGLIHDPTPYAFSDGRYKPADQYWYNDDDCLGIELVLLNRLNRNHNSEWLVNQDLILALGLIREGDSWLRADEGYIEVIRQRRAPDGTTAAIEIRAEHLRDYLCARGLALRLVQYRQRLQIVQDAAIIPWHGQLSREETPIERFELSSYAIGEDGAPHGRVAVMKAWRTDVDHAVDVPAFGPEDDSNTGFESYEFEREGSIVHRVEGELWRDEWVEPAAQSERVRGDTPAEKLYFSVGAAGEKVAGEKLNNEDVGLYLWFKADVIESLLGYRGSSLTWYTAETGSISCSPDYEVHFGINENSRINVYAYDVARLPLWQQQIWHGHNISPDGPPAAELQDAQFRCAPAKTTAPEIIFQLLLKEVNELFIESYGSPLFKPHEHYEQIVKQCQRFRALKENGVLALAKDIARLTADSIDISLLRKLVTLSPEEQNIKGLKLLERLLQEYCDKDTAYRVMKPLHISYGLRLGDAHLPSKTQVQKALDDLSVQPETPPLIVGKKLLASVCSALRGVGRIVYAGMYAARASNETNGTR